MDVFKYSTDCEVFHGFSNHSRYILRGLKDSMIRFATNLQTAHHILGSEIQCSHPDFINIAIL